MLKLTTSIILLFTILSCTQPTDKNALTPRLESNQPLHFYSNTIQDTFSIFIGLPNAYNPNKSYPIVYLLDATLYFDIIATTLHKYSEVGLAPSVILVGIGYKDFQTMDSLRNRDYTYPTAIPEYEMTTSGGAERFLSFITHDLTPYIDSNYKIDTANRILAGHSLGGYFPLYTLLQSLSDKSNYFSGYIAASPSIEYNHYYLINQFKKIAPHKNRGKKIKTYLAFGGMEDAEADEDSSMMRLNEITTQLSIHLAQKQAESLVYQCDIYSNLDHMDTPIPSIIKGLQWMLGEDK